MPTTAALCAQNNQCVESPAVTEEALELAEVSGVSLMAALLAPVLLSVDLQPHPKAEANARVQL